jgi:hypothetical protein
MEWSRQSAKFVPLEAYAFRGYLKDRPAGVGENRKHRRGEKNALNRLQEFREKRVAPLAVKGVGDIICLQAESVAKTMSRGSS